MAAAPPPKPWERQSAAVAGSSAVSPLGSATGGVSHWDQPQPQSDTVDAMNESTALAAAPSRPWLNSSGPTFAQPSGYGAGSGMYGSGGYGMGGSLYGRPGYGTSMYGSGGGMYGGGGGMLGSGMYGGGGGGYGSTYGSGAYGGGMGGGYGGYGGSGFGSGFGMGGGGGMFGGGPVTPYGQQGGPEGPPRPPGAWESVLRGLHGVMGVFGRITMLVDENTYAVNFFIQALLQLLDRFGSLYGELARWVLRLLGWGRASRKAAELEQAQRQALQGGQPGGLPPPPQQALQGQHQQPGALPAASLGGGGSGGGRGFDAAWGIGGSSGTASR